MSNFVILLLDFVLSVNKYLKQWCLSDGSIMKFIVKTVLLLLCFVLLLFCFFAFFCFYSVLFCFCLFLFCICSAFLLLFCFWFLAFGFWILAFLMTWLLFLHHKNIISFSKYSIVRLFGFLAFWLLTFDFWLLAFGFLAFWLLAFCFWLLAFGFPYNLASFSPPQKYNFIFKIFNCQTYLCRPEMSTVVR